MKIEETELSKLVPYKLNNKKHSKEQIDHLANSIKKFGFNQPIVVDDDYVVLVGHARLEAARKLGLDKVPTYRVLGLSEVDKKAYRILDNKLAADAEWDFENLRTELALLQESNFQFDEWNLTSLLEGVDALSVDVEDEKDNPYSQKISGPVYKPTSKTPPPVSELYKTDKCAELIARIASCETLSSEERTFLCQAAQRHVVFDYQQIAEFYSHARREVQELMEDSALVIIDFEKAIENGFISLTEELASFYLADSATKDNQNTIPEDSK